MTCKAEQGTGSESPPVPPSPSPLTPIPSLRKASGSYPQIGLRSCLSALFSPPPPPSKSKPRSLSESCKSLLSGLSIFTLASYLTHTEAVSCLNPQMQLIQNHFALPVHLNKTQTPNQKQPLCCDPSLPCQPPRLQCSLPTVL